VDDRGHGIIHRELAFRNERAHTLQLWVNLPGELTMVDTARSLSATACASA
jgi:redox-sensitive bicupin YhaK (pirin superfamily)